MSCLVDMYYSVSTYHCGLLLAEHLDLNFLFLFFILTVSPMIMYLCSIDIWPPLMRPSFILSIFRMFLVGTVTMCYREVTCRHHNNGRGPAASSAIKSFTSFYCTPIVLQVFHLSRPLLVFEAPLSADGSLLSLLVS